MKKKILLSCMTAAMIVGLVPQSSTTVQANNNYQGNQFEQGKYDIEAEFPYGDNWSESSPYVGSEKKEVKWMFEFKEFFPKGRTVIGKDGTIYAMTHKKLYALNKDGSVKWETVEGTRRTGTPVIGADGTIYATVEAAGYYYLEAYNPDGTLKWKSKSKHGALTSAIDKDGTIYVNGSQYLEAYNQDGSLKWRTDRNFGAHRNKILISKEGLIHTLLANGGDSKKDILYTHDKNGVEKWRLELSGESRNKSFTLGPNGDIYYNAEVETLVISSDGQVKHKWKRGTKAYGAPTVSEKDGTVYVSGDYHLYAYNPDGSVKWSYKIESRGTPTLDSNGKIYILTRDNKLGVINPGGTLESITDYKGIGTTGEAFSQITIGKDGTIYVSSYGSSKTTQGAVIAIGDPNAGETPCPRPDNYLDSIEAKLKTNDLTDVEKQEAIERLTKEQERLAKVLNSLQ